MAKDSIVIIDYGSGNLRSAAKSFERVCADQALDYEVKVSNKAEDLRKAAKIILPGQGAFGDCMAGLSALDGMIETLEERVLKDGVPFLGICVGMQLLASRGMEHGVHAGLGWIGGDAVPIEPGVDEEGRPLKIPHMGWNSLVFPNIGSQDNRHFVLRSVTSSENYYFVHSFRVKLNNDHHALAMTDYGGLIPAVIGRDNIIGMQFHPEKSHKAGLRLLSDFLLWQP